MQKMTHKHNLIRHSMPRLQYFISRDCSCSILTGITKQEYYLLFLLHVHHQYKYQINIDGTVAAYRLPYLLAGDSVVLKQDSSYYEHFYNELQPWEHYIPIRADLGDLLEKIQWAREHDEEVTMRVIADIRFGSECRDMWW